MRFDELAESCLLRLMALVGGVAKYILAWRQHTDLTPTSVVPPSRTFKQSALVWHIYFTRVLSHRVKKYVWDHHGTTSVLSHANLCPP